MSQRTERVAELIQREVSSILRVDIHNPRIGFVTILSVDVTPDLKTARVYYSILGTDEEKKTTDIELRNSAKFVKKLVNERLSLRFAVDIRFIRETALDASFRIQGILDKLRREGMEKGAPPAPDA